MPHVRKEKRVYGKQLLVRKTYAIALRRFITENLPCQKLADIIGCSKQEFKNYIESQWQPGMNWDNYLEDWCIDHIVPMVFFDHLKQEEIALCWHHINLKPLFHKDNHLKDHCPIAAAFFLDTVPESDIKQKLIEINKPQLLLLTKYLKNSSLSLSKAA